MRPICFRRPLLTIFASAIVRINNSLINLPPDGVTADAVGIDRPTSNITNSIYKFTLGSSGFQIGPTPPADQFQTQNNYNFVETLSWVRGKHTWRFGGEYTRVNIDKQFPQVFNGQLFFVNTAGVAPTESEPVGVGGLTDFQKVLAGQVDFSFGGGGVYNHQYRTNNYSFFVQDDWKVNQQLTVNLGLRTEVIGAFHDNLCHIGNFDLALANAGEYPLIYGGCANKLNVAGMTGSGSDTTLKNDYTTGLGPRFGFAWDVFGHHNTTVRGGYGIYFVREDVGTVDQLSFQAPILPIAFSGGPAGCMAQFFKINPTGTPSCPTPPNPNPNGLPTAGVLDPSFLPCLGTITGFSGGTDNFPDISCASGSPGVVPTQFLFALAVPRDFVAPNTQQWNFTIQRDLGKNWVSRAWLHRVTRHPPSRNPHQRSGAAGEPGSSAHCSNHGRPRNTHGKHGRQRACSFHIDGSKRLQRYAVVCQRRVFTLPLVPDHSLPSLGCRLFPGSVHILAVD